MKRVIFNNEPDALFVGQALLDEGEIQILVTAVNLVVDDSVAEVREMDSDLMFAASARQDAEE